MFDQHHFPYQYECENCGTSTTVTHEDVQDVPSHFVTSTVAEAVEYVMTSRRGWSTDGLKGALCPDCVDGAY